MGLEKVDAFSKPIPTKLLDKLADLAEQDYCSNNLTLLSTKRQNGFFYQYLKTYQNQAAINLQIHNLTLKDAVDKVTAEVVSTDYLARIITYFEQSHTKESSFRYLTQYYTNITYPEAEKILSEKHNINFEIPIQIEDSLFLNESPFH